MALPIGFASGAARSSAEADAERTTTGRCRELPDRARAVNHHAACEPNTAWRDITAQTGAPSGASRALGWRGSNVTGLANASSVDSTQVQQPIARGGKDSN